MNHSFKSVILAAALAVASSGEAYAAQSMPQPARLDLRIIEVKNSAPNGRTHRLEVQSRITDIDRDDAVQAGGLMACRLRITGIAEAAASGKLRPAALSAAESGGEVHAAGLHAPMRQWNHAIGRQGRVNGLGIDGIVPFATKSEPASSGWQALYTFEYIEAAASAGTVRFTVEATADAYDGRFGFFDANTGAVVWSSEARSGSLRVGRAAKPLRQAD